MNLHSLNICIISLILFWQSAQRALFQGFDGQGRIFGILAAICFFSTLACQKATLGTVVPLRSYQYIFSVPPRDVKHRSILFHYCTHIHSVYCPVRNLVTT